MGNQCGEGTNDPVHWREVMVLLFQKLQNIDAHTMSDSEFAKNLIALMTERADWRYCRDSLRAKLREADKTGLPLTSAEVLATFREEEVERGIAPAIVSINALTAAKGKNCFPQ